MLRCLPKRGLRKGFAHFIIRIMHDFTYGKIRHMTTARPFVSGPHKTYSTRIANIATMGLIEKWWETASSHPGGRRSSAWFVARGLDNANRVRDSKARAQHYRCASVLFSFDAVRFLCVIVSQKRARKNHGNDRTHEKFSTRNRVQSKRQSYVFYSIMKRTVKHT